MMPTVLLENFIFFGIRTKEANEIKLFQLKDIKLTHSTRDQQTTDAAAFLSLAILLFMHCFCVSY